MKKIIGFLILIITVTIAIIFMGKNFILKEMLERRLTKINNAPVYIESVDFSPFDNYIVLKNISITGVKDKKQFIKMDELKTFYTVDYLKKVITLNDTEISNILFFNEKNMEEENNSKTSIFADKISKAEEEVKKDKVLNELKKIYLEKIGVDIEKLDLIVKEKYKELKKLEKEVSNINEKEEVLEIKDSLKKIKNSKGKISDILEEIGKIGKISKKVIKDVDIDKLKTEFKDLQQDEEFQKFLDDVVINLLNRNKFVLTDLDTYINLYLNLIYEEKIYDFYLKYLNVLNELEERKKVELENNDKNSWEIYFNSISLTSKMYGIDFNGEIKNFSSKLSKNKDNIYFKLFGEKGETIGELKGYFNLATYESSAKLTIPEANSKDINNEVFSEGEATVEQYLLVGEKHLLVDGDIRFKNIKLDSSKVIENMKIEDNLIKEILTPILEEVREAKISYRYNIEDRKLELKSDLSEILSNIINDENSSLKLKMRNKIKTKYLERII